MKVKRYKCEGGQGCTKPGCEFIAKGTPWSEDEEVCICPYNHWRSCKWVEVKAKQAEGGGK